MMQKQQLFVFVCLLLINILANSLKAYHTVIIPEQPLILYLNDKYVHNVTANVRRVKRRGLYATNLQFHLKETLHNNATVDVIFYEFLHNEYKRSFVEMHFKLCDLINKDVYLGWIIRNAGLTKCPLPPGSYSMGNMSFSLDVPYKWPFEKGKAVLSVNVSTSLMIAKGEEVLTFKQSP